MNFPAYNGRDRVKAKYKLLTEALGIPHLLAVTGIYRGAEASVQFAVSYPEFMDGILPIAGGALWGTHGFLFGSRMMSNITFCKGWDGGNYDENPKKCAANALSVLIPYFYTREWWDQYIGTYEDYTNWRKPWGDYYLDIQDARDLYYEVMAGGLGWVGDTPGFDGDLKTVLGTITAKTLFIYNPRDQFYLPHHIETQVKAIPDARAAAIDSNAGHMMCCNADPQATLFMGKVIREFLLELSAR